jgi:HAD superfamily hydrolase (TIGR01509 family)
VNVDAIFFDFGGTLFSYRGVQGRSFYPILLESLERLGVDAEPGDAGRAWRRASAEAYREHHPLDYYLHKDLFVDTFRRFALHVGGEASPADLEWYYETQRRMVVEGFALRPGCVEMLGRLRGAGLHVGIVSNIDDDYLLPMMERAELESHLDAWTSSEEARSCKPHAGIYEHALRKAGAVAERTVFVGDSPEHDIVGARRLGMRTVLIREDEVETPGAGAGEAAAPHHTVRELPEVAEWVLATG